MKIKEKMSNKPSIYYNQISKKGLLENDKKLLLKKFGFKNLQLSHNNMNLDNINTINYYLAENYLISLKNDIRKPQKTCSLIYLNNIKNNSQKMTQIKNKSKNKIIDNQNNFFTNSNNNISTKKIKAKFNKSTASLPLNSLINLNEKSGMQLHKGKNNISSVNVTDTTAQNSLKTNIGILSNAEMIKPIEKNKSKINNNIETKNCSSPNLLDKVTNPINNFNKEKPPKVYNNSTYLSKSNKKINIKKNINNRNDDHISKYNNIIDKKINKTEQNINPNISDNKNNNYLSDNINKINDKNNCISKTNEKEMKHNTENNHSENTKKESIKEINRIFNDKILQNIEKNNYINEIITNNFQNNKINTRNIKQDNYNINEQITINIENNMNSQQDENNKQEEQKDSNNKEIMLPHSDTMLELKNKSKTNTKKESSQNINIIIPENQRYNKNNEINSDNNIENSNNESSLEERDEKDEKVTINNIKHNGNRKYSIFNENYDKDNEYNDENKNELNNRDSSSIKTHENICKNYNDLNKNKEIEKPKEQEFQQEDDRQSEQTQITLDKNYILSKFIKQPIYDISSRFLNEESINTKHILPNKKFYFIEDIEEEIKKMPFFSFKKILNLSNDSLYNLISYSYDNYSSIISINNLLKKKIEKSLKNKFEHAIQDFKHKYSSFLKVIDFNFIQKDFILNHKKNNLLNLIIKCQIITEEINKSYEIGCNYISNKKKSDYFWKFDVQNKKDIKLWICTELNKVNNTSKNFSYTSQVSPFCNNDIIKFQFNIFSLGNVVDPLSIEWIEPVITLVPGGVFEKSKYISKYSFDQIRACEVETQILFWKNKLPQDDGEIVNEVKKIYGKFFDIKNIRFDVSKFYFFKIEMKAKKIGCLKENKFSSFDINIIDNESQVENEIQCIYLMNSYYYSKKMDIRIGTNLVLYIVDMKR